MGNRFEPRALVRLPVVVSGIDAEGNPFDQTAYACDVSRRGARVDGIGCLRGPGETITLEHKGRTAKFFVVWVGLPGTPEDGQIGVRKLERNKDIWGLNLPQPQTDKFVQPEMGMAHVWDAIPTSDEGDAGAHSEPETDTETKSAAVAHLRQQKELQEPENVGDRRQYRRYAVEGSAEMYMKGSQTRTWGPLTDISGSGCYVEMYVPYSAGTELQMAVEVADTKIAAEGIVRVVYPGLGIGIEFTNITDEDRIRLNAMLAPIKA